MSLLTASTLHLQCIPESDDTLGEKNDEAPVWFSDNAWVRDSPSINVVSITHTSDDELSCYAF